MKRYAPLSLTLVFILYMFANVAYFAASEFDLRVILGTISPVIDVVPKEAIRTSKELTASLFFIAVFGNSKSVTALSALIAVSSFGNLLSVIIGSSRIIRECGRLIYSDS
jgi:amino acid transporter